ncbi:MAG: hypothetical protein ACR2J3_02780 [Aridibacter sp.]
MNTNIFREYDIRGIVGEDLNAENVEVLAKAIGTFFRQNDAKKIVIGFDARESSPQFCKVLTKGLNETGCDVVQIGRVPTPVLYHTVYTKNVGGGVMITGSHNPSNHNGFKICLGKQTLFGSQIREIKEIAFSNKFSKGNGKAEILEVLEDYKKDIFTKINFGKKN